MSRTLRAIIAVVFVLVMTFSAISIFQNVGGRLKVDVTGQKLYTLSAGTRSILAKLNQPIKLKLYYAKTAAMKGPDQIKYFNNYYEFVKSLLEEYVAAAKGMVDLEIIDPRPFSNDEVEATRYGLKKFPITEEENFIFGLVAQTQFGVEKAIPFFVPDRQSFVEYDISYLIDMAITRQKKTIGVLSSLAVMGEVSDYMAQMMLMQNQQPKTPWTIVQHLRQQYEVKGIPADINDINDIDILLVIHPKNLPEQTLFAIDQFVLKGGRTIICIDPYCFADQQNPMTSQFGTASQGSNLKKLLNTWGLDMTELTFAGDRGLAITASAAAGQRPEKIIGFLELTPPQSFNRDNVITAQLNSVKMLFAGVLNETALPDDVNKEGQIERTPLITTTNKGNSFKVDSPFEISALDPASLIQGFIDGTKPVVMGYLMTGRFKSSFPEGIEIKTDSKPKDANEPAKPPVRITGLTEAAENCAVVVFADVDFISDAMAYYRNPLFGSVIVGDNSALLMNAIDDLGGSSDLISIRSRGGFRRPFTVIDDIEAKAEAETADEVAKLNAEIAGFENELRTLITSTKEEERQIIGSSIVQKTKDLELKKLEARRQLREVRMQKRQRIEHLGNVLRSFNMLAAPAVILVIAVALGVRRSVMKRHYISHASDA
jgi:ABC-2 type transport system permease protein